MAYVPITATTPGKAAIIPAPSLVVKTPSLQEIEQALIKSNGLITYAAQELKCPIDVVKKAIRKFKTLRTLVMQLREVMLDAAEDTLLYRVTEKRDIIATMFLLKTIGKRRGWIEGPERSGETASKPVYIKLLPVGTDYTEGKGKKGKKQQAITAMVPALTPGKGDIKFTKDERELVTCGLDDFIDGECVE